MTDELLIKPVMYGDYIISEEIYTKDNGLNLLLLTPDDNDLPPLPETYTDRFGEVYTRRTFGLTHAGRIFVHFSGPLVERKVK